MQTTAVNQSQHLLKSYVMALLNRKDYSADNWPKLLILDCLFLKGFSITKPTESKMSMIVERREGSNNYN